jgi:outer membrane receptor protein involved in Fe transport
VTVRYVGPVKDTSATNDTTGEFWPVDSWTTVNLRLGVKLGQKGTGLWGTQLSVGVNNLFDKNPPRADESGGFFGSLHNAQGRVFYASIEKNF